MSFHEPLDAFGHTYLLVEMAANLTHFHGPIGLGTKDFTTKPGTPEGAGNISPFADNKLASRCPSVLEIDGQFALAISLRSLFLETARVAIGLVVDRFLGEKDLVVQPLILCSENCRILALPR